MSFTINNLNCILIYINLGRYFACCFINQIREMLNYAIIFDFKKFRIILTTLKIEHDRDLNEKQKENFVVNYL